MEQESDRHIGVASAVKQTLYCCVEEGHEPKGEVFDLPVNLKCQPLPLVMSFG